MNRKSSKFIILLTMMTFLILSGCFTIMNVTQPATVSVNETFEATFEVMTEPDPDYGWDDDPHYAIIGMMIPLDWTINSVYFRGSDLDPEQVSCSYLHPDSADAEPGGVQDYWTDTLNVYFPPPDGMHWVVYQGDEPARTLAEVTYNDVFMEFVSGTTEGTFGIGYFVSNAALDFTEEYWYDVSLDNELTVSDVSSLNGDISVPEVFTLSQNFPNPFNPVTHISYTLPRASEVLLTLHDLQGRELRVLQNGYRQAGTHEIHLDAGDLASGVYLYRLKAGAFVSTRKLMILR